MKLQGQRKRGTLNCPSIVNVRTIYKTEFEMLSPGIHLGAFKTLESQDGESSSKSVVNKLHTGTEDFSFFCLRGSTEIHK